MDNNQSCIRVFADKMQIDNCRETLRANEKSFGQLSGLLALAENDETMPPIPDIRAKTGVMQHNDAAMADMILAPASFPDFDLLFILFPF